MLPKGYGLLKIRLSTLRLLVSESLAVKFWFVDGVSEGEAEEQEFGERGSIAICISRPAEIAHIVDPPKGLCSFCEEIY